MKKRDILMAIVGITGLANIVLSKIIGGYPPILELFLTIPFYVIILIFYRKTTLIVIFSVLTILSQFGYYMVLENLASHPGLDGTIRLYASFSFFSGILGFFIAFVLVLQHKTYKFTELSFFAFSIINYVFFSYFTFYLQSMLITIFGPFELHISKMLNVYFGVEIGMEVVVLVLEVLVIFFLERNKWYEHRLLLKDQQIMNSSITE
ncbi:MAG: hypothetical protein JEZ05_11140 [Tenericutes bacterium]|nr:hypothetical protein [Mycoplasmatota bacterium]